MGLHRSVQQSECKLWPVRHAHTCTYRKHRHSPPIFDLLHDVVQSTILLHDAGRHHKLLHASVKAGAPKVGQILRSSKLWVEHCSLKVVQQLFHKLCRAADLKASLGFSLAFTVEPPLAQIDQVPASLMLFEARLQHIESGLIVFTDIASKIYTLS